MSLGDHAYTVLKDRRKKRRVLIQFIILLLVLLGIFYAFFFLKSYTPYAEDEESSTLNTGFIALSYGGVDRTGRTSDLIGEPLLNDHLAALRKAGYVTVTSKDVAAYYHEGKRLPPRALYLMFEDGRRDTAIFAQKSLEKYNFHATMFSYAEKLESKDPKFLSKRDMQSLMDSSFWDMGSDGYRLHFINVFDRYHNYLGELTPLQFSMLRSSLGRNYNHYLMDYLRDKDGYARESYQHMVRRIDFDYMNLRDTYQRELGFVPEAYALMHANTTQFGNQDDVSAVNEKWIRRLFTINFNREGSSFNAHNSSPYDLTRLEPGTKWPVNHLLMRVAADTKSMGKIPFEEGDEKRQKAWKRNSGASEITGNSLILTTAPYGIGLTELLGSKAYQNFSLSVRLTGNTFGRQQLFLRASEDLSRCLIVELSGGRLIVTERRHGKDTPLLQENVDVLLDRPRLSVEEAQKEAEVKDYETLARYAPTRQAAERYAQKAAARKAKPARSVKEGAAPYEPKLERNARESHSLTLSLQDDQLLITLDGKALDPLSVLILDPGCLFLGADMGKNESWSQKNQAESVYDATFEDLVIHSQTGLDPEKEQVLYSLKLSGLDRFRYEAGQYWEDILNWFLRYI